MSNQPPLVQSPPPQMRQWMAFVERALSSSGKTYTAKTATATGDVSPGTVGPGSFAAGALDNYTITSPYIESGPEEVEGGRMLIDSQGIHFTDPWFRNTIDLDVSTSVGFLTGSLYTATDDVYPRAAAGPTVYDFTYPDPVTAGDTDHITWTDHGLNLMVRETDALPAFIGVQQRSAFETDPDGNMVVSVADTAYVLIRSARKTATGKSTEVLIEDDSITLVVNSSSQQFEGSGSAAPAGPVRVASVKISAAGVAITGNLTVTGTVTANYSGA